MFAKIRFLVERKGKNMTSTPPSSANPANIAQATRAVAMRGMIISVVINGAIPFLIYWVLTHSTSISSFLALVASGIPSLIESLVGIIRRKRIDFLAGIVLTGIGVALIITALGGNPKIYQIRESFFTVTFGLALLVSLVLPRPIMFYIARHFVSGNNPANVAHFNSFWQNERFRRSMRVMSAVWGIGLLLEAAIRISLVIALSVEQFLAISSFVTYGIIALLTIWTFSYGRAGRQRGTEPILRIAKEEQATSATSTPTESTR
jgi:hypothetical protein